MNERAREREDSGRVVVFGSINMDVVATALRHPTVGETVPGLDLAYYPGGKGANQAVAAAKMGAECELVGSVGSDAAGEELRDFLNKSGVGTAGISVAAGTPTGTALIVVAEGDNTIVVVPGANGTVAESSMGSVELSSDDVLVMQLEIPLGAVADALSAARKSGALSILNAAPALPCPDDLLAAVDVLVVNEAELGVYSSTPAPDNPADTASWAVEAATRLRDRGIGRQGVVVTLGPKGAAVVTDEGSSMIDGLSVDVVDTTGAGDCFVGALAAGLARGWTLRVAAEEANAAAALSVQRPGAGPSMPTRDEVLALDRENS